MSGPARAGLFIYANDVEGIVHFYESVARMTKRHAEGDLVVLESPDIQLLVHRTPASIAADIVITAPPARRENTALKFFFTVASISEARSVAADLGGEVFSESWQGPGFIVCNAMDPEGNVFQVREIR